MALKIGRLEVGVRLLISLTAIAIAYGYLGSYLCTLMRYNNYLVAGLLLAISVGGIFAIPQSLGGLLAAIASITIVYWQSNLTYSLMTAIACLALYLLGFRDVRYEPEADQKLSVLELSATAITIALTIVITLIILQTQIPLNWMGSLMIGAIAGAITLVGKQLSYIDLSQKTIWRSLGILGASSLAIGYAVSLFLYATTKATPNVL
jgi:hypothetical protein